VQVRKEFDIEAMRKELRQKADLPQVNADLENHEFKISTLDRNLVCIANDFETFQTAINKMH
jgi:septal ring factor EnvC (AmiA/AmiB activator)